MKKEILKYYRKSSELPKSLPIEELFEGNDIKITFHAKEKTESIIILFDVKNGNLKYGDNRFIAIEMSENLFLQFDNPLKYIKNLYIQDDIQYI